MSGIGAMLAMVLALLVLIFLHELGHFLAARAVGIRATKFYLGFPPSIFRFHRGGVEYGIGATMLGGYVKLPGMFRPRPHEVGWRLEPWIQYVMDPLSDSELRLRLSAAYRQVGRAGDIDELRAGLHELRGVLQTIELRASSEAALESGQAARELVARAGKLRSQVDSQLDDCADDAYWRAALWRRMVVIVAGPLANVLVAMVVMWVAVMFLLSGIEFKIGSVVPGSAAQTAGLKEGDVVLEWDGKPVEGYVLLGPQTNLLELIDTGRERPIEIRVRRDGEEQTVTVASGAIPGIGTRRGIAFDADLAQASQRNGPVEAARLTGPALWEVTTGTLQGLGRIATGKEEPRGSVVGAVRVAPRIQQAGEFPVSVALISLVLAIVNVLPILPMDGGHLAFGLVEFLRRGKPVPRTLYERYSMAGLALMLVVFAVAVKNDLTMKL